MQLKIKYLLLALFLVCSFPVRSNDGLKRGLFFRSFEVDKDKRTCLNLTTEKPLSFHKGFAVAFDLNLRSYSQTFGYVFRIICNDTLNVDFLANISSGVTNFSVVFKNQTVIQYKNSELSENVENTWINVWFEFDPAENRISLTLNEIKKDAACSLAGLKHFNLYFGGNTHGVFSTTDITPMTVRDIRIFDGKKNLVRHWALGKHLSNYVYDECIYARAEVYNPVWEMDHHAKWTKRENLIFEGQNPHISFDRNNNRFYFANSRKILIYDLNRQKIDTIKVEGGTPFNIVLSNQIFYDPNRDVLLSYDFEGRRLAVFDFSTRSWDNNNDSSIMTRYSHHSRLFVAEDSLLVTLGGYGYHRYNSLFYKCKVVENRWEVADLSRSIPQLYLGSMGRLDDRNLLYFGGFGNESGLQEESPRNYYDLYTIQMDSLHVKKIWELPNPKEHFTNSNSLVMDTGNGKFYALAYPNKRFSSEITLHEYHLNAPEYRVVGDSIPYFFNDIESYCNLYQSSDGAELYAVTSFAKDNNADIRIYSMSFPPLSFGEIVQYPPVHPPVRLWLLLFALAVGLAAAVLIIIRKRKTARTVVETVVNEQINDKDEEPIVYDNLWAEKKPSSIHLLGNFQMVDNHGNEITKNFTPTTTQLFLLFLVSTIKNGQGITSAKLRKILWFDKDDDSARNNRNVYVNKLRAILKPFTEIRIVKKDDYWTIQSEKTVFCDYERALVLIQMLQTGERFNKKLLTELVDIALRGTLLPYVQQTEWLELYQTDYTNRLIECLMRYSRYDELKNDLLLLKIADVLLLHDNTDENAIRLKCYALFRSGRKNQALQAFNKFTADYESLLAAKHNLVFDELVKSM